MSNAHIQNNPIINSRELQGVNLLGMTLTNTVIINDSYDGNLINQSNQGNYNSMIPNIQDNGNQIKRTINKDNHKYPIENIKQFKSQNEDIIQYASSGEERIKCLNKEGTYIYDIDMNNETEQSFLNKKIIIENINNNIENKEEKDYLLNMPILTTQIINSDSQNFELLKSDFIPNQINIEKNNINNEIINKSTHELNNEQKSIQNEKHCHVKVDNTLKFMYNPIAPKNASIVLVKVSDKNNNKIKEPKLINNKINNSQFENEVNNREKLLQLIPDGTIESKISEQNIQDNNIDLPIINESIFQNEITESVYV
jgi:hypothetical protein